MNQSITEHIIKHKELSESIQVIIREPSNVARHSPIQPVITETTIADHWAFWITATTHAILSVLQV
jgi:hypothetical protein